MDNFTTAPDTGPRALFWPCVGTICLGVFIASGWGALR